LILIIRGTQDNAVGIVTVIRARRSGVRIPCLSGDVQIVR